jgi:hypothetical protein
MRSLVDASQASGELRSLITEAGITCSKVWSMTFDVVPGTSEARRLTVRHRGAPGL